MRAYAAIVLALSLSSSTALDALIAPSSLVADQNFPLTYSNPDAAINYRIYLAATLSDISGPTCYLINTTALPTSGLSLTIPADVGPDANYYSIAISPLTSNGTSSSDGAISYSQPISITGLTASYTTYETSLRGAPFWDADLLPCGSYACARKCASEEFPDGSEVGKDGEESYGRMVQCLEAGDGIVVEPEKGANMASETESATGTASTSVAQPSPTGTTIEPSDAGAGTATEEEAVATSSDAAVHRHVSGAVVLVGVAGAMAMMA